MFTVEAVIGPEGGVHLLEPVHVQASRRAFVTVLDEEPPSKISDTLLISEPALAEDWSRPEEDIAWEHLQ